MFRSFLVAMCLTAIPVIAFRSTAQAQLPGDSPYARSRETGWPRFYKPLKVSPHDQFYYAMGWCRTNHYHYTATDLVNIDRLPEVDYTGEFREIYPDGFTLRVPDRAKPVAIHVHPEATQVIVRGEISVASLKLGDVVRCQASVDRRGHATEPVDYLELCSPSSDQSFAVQAGEEGPIVGKLLRLAGKQLYLGIKTGPIRTVTLRASETCQVSVSAEDFRLARGSAQVRVEGRIYRADDRIPADQVFATEVEITLMPAESP